MVSYVVVMPLPPPSVKSLDYTNRASAASCAAREVMAFATLGHRDRSVASPWHLPRESCLKVGAKADLKQRDERTVHFAEWVSRQRNE